MNEKKCKNCKWKTPYLAKWTTKYRNTPVLNPCYRCVRCSEWEKGGAK